MKGIKIKGTGKCIPSHVLTNDNLASMVETSDEWIQSRTGIQKRHICREEDHRSLCLGAARQAMERAGVNPEEIGACIVATATGQTIVPAAACMLQKDLGLPQDIPCFDLSAACTGFLSALHTMECLLNASGRKYGLVVGCEVLSRVVNWEDRDTCILFGDGAGACVVECREGWDSIGAVLGTDGDDQVLRLPGPGTEEGSLLTMEGTKVFKFAVQVIPRCIEQVLEKHGCTMEEVDQLVLHQANARIIDSVMRKYRIPPEKCRKNIYEYGNTSAASVAILLSELEEDGTLRSGSRVLAVGFGGGLTWAGALIEFA